MDNGFSLTGTLQDVGQNLLQSFSDFIPRAVTAIIVILIGLLVAKIAERFLRGLFEKLKFDDLLEKVGVTESLRKFGMDKGPGYVLSRSVYFLLVILFTQSVTRAVGLNTIADAIGAFFGYLPNLLTAFLVLLVGMIVSQFAGNVVTRSASDSGVDYAPMLGRMVSGLIFFVVLIMSISQLKIDTEIVRIVVTIILSAFGLGLALTFGLGSRSVTRNILAGFYARKLFTIGEQIEIKGESGTLNAITPLQTLIEREGSVIAIPNQVFLDEVVKQ
ncbi:MAG: mechanosensitive ion channel [Candidatus Eisenbacteria bacterium]|uniref:Mechanosensitive ion channel n=1 Tax=Eiseniibacteriota bacterium TaxID=2212470 RepID=A0A7Y2E937_UNCEI|nr:mechanosensitive ion channel [Candidatus Eisenbacteria bacterium]